MQQHELVELDWDNVLPSHASGSAEEIVAERAADDDNVIAVIEPQPRVQLKTSGWSLTLPAPQHMNDLEKVLAASRMRGRKGALALSLAKGGAKEMVEDALEKLRKCGLLRDGCRTKVTLNRNGILVITTPGGGKSALPYEALQAVAFASFATRNVTAKAFNLDVKTVTTSKTVMAEIAHVSLKRFLENKGAELDEFGSVSFISAIAADATSERITLTMAGVPHELRGAASSQWHVLVSTGRFSYVQAVSDDIDKKVVKVPVQADRGCRSSEKSISTDPTLL